MTYTICAKQAEAMSDYVIDRDLADFNRSIEREESRSELIASIQDEMYERRMAALSDDDIECALQSGNGKFLCQRIRDAIQKVDGPEAYGVLKSLVSCWIREDAEIEAIKSVERSE